MNPKSTKYNLIFDFGGVVFEPQYITANKFFEKHGKVEGVHFVGSEVWKKVQARFPSYKTVKMQSGIFWKDYTLEIGLPVEVGDQLCDFLEKEWSKQTYPQTIKAIKLAKQQDLKVYYLTNTTFDIFETRKQADIFGYFDGGVNDLEQPISKPDPRIYQFLLDKYQLQAENCIFIDDTLENIQTAQNLGFKTIHFSEDLDLEQTLEGFLGEEF